MSEITISWNPPPSPVTGYNIYRGTLQNNEAPTPYAADQAPPAAFALTSVAAPSGGQAVYQGTISGDTGNNTFAGVTIAISGFTNPANNGSMVCVSSTPTSLTMNTHAAGTAETAAGSALPNPYFVDGGVFPGRQYSYQVQSIVGSAVSADSLSILSPPVPFPLTPADVVLGTAISFEVLAGSTVTNTGTTDVAGDVGVWPGTSITGFGPPSSISGAFHAGDFVAQAAQADLTAAFNDGMSRTGATVLSGDIGGQTLGPGVYSSASSLAITGALYLDAGGDPNAVWIFQIGSTLTTAVGNSAVLMENGGQASNVFWIVGSSATLNGGTHFSGNVLAQASITVGALTNINGRLLARVGAITLINDEINISVVGQLIMYSPGGHVNVNDIFFDCASQSYQLALNSGTTGTTRPIFSPVIGVTTQDGPLSTGVTWLSLDPPLPTVLLTVPPSGPNVAPPPPATPTGLAFVSER